MRISSCSSWAASRPPQSAWAEKLVVIRMNAVKTR